MVRRRTVGDTETSPASVTSLLLDEGRSDRIVDELEESAAVSDAVTRWTLGSVGTIFLALLFALVIFSDSILLSSVRSFPAACTVVYALLRLFELGPTSLLSLVLFPVLHVLYYISSPMPTLLGAMTDGGSVLFLCAVVLAQHWQSALVHELAELRRMRVKVHSA